MKAHRQTLTILLVACAARSLVLWHVMAHQAPGWLYGRGIEMGVLAQSLVSGHGLSSPFGGATGPTALLAPGYPLLISAFFRLFGVFSRNAAVAIMLAQMGFSLLTVLLIVKSTRQLFGDWAASLAGFFWALSPPLLWMPTIFWDTCLSTLLLTGMIAMAMRPAQDRGLVAGAYTGLAGLVNPALLPSLLAILGWIAWQQRTIRRAYLPCALLSFCVIYAAWPLRNAHALHAAVATRTTVGLELWMGNHPGGQGFLEEALFPTFNRAEYDRYVALGEVAYMREKTQAALAYARAQPLRCLQLSALRFSRFWTGTGNRDGSIFFAIQAIFTTMLGLSGLWRLIATHRARTAALFSMPLILFPLPYYITHAEFRYRLVIDPLLTILAAHCVESS